MSTTKEEAFKRWTARRKSAPVLEIIQGRKTVLEASRQYELTPSEIEAWIEHGKAAMENALRARKQLQSLLGKAGHDRTPPAGNERRNLHGLDLKALRMV